MAGKISLEDEIQILLRREPFHPFVLKISSGDQYVVETPFSLAMNESTIYLAHRKKTSTVIRKNQLVAVEVSEPQE